MKKSALKVITPIFAFSLLFGVGFFVGENNQKVLETSAYDVNSLPTTIDLNDTSAANIRNYYSSLNSLSASERQGTNLLKNLKPILKNGQKYLSYDGSSASTGKAIWDVYCIVDRDWNKSPASALPSTAGTYDSSTNKITGYNWGANSSDYENPYLHALYYNRDKTAIAQAYGDHNNNTSTGINREHIWPKGAGFDNTGSGGARGDIMHLWAANGHTNNIHSNNFYGYVDTSKSYTDIGDTSTYSMCAGNLSGKSKTFPSSSNTVFEPQDSDKGDIARACFYMVARYNYLSGSDNDGIDSNNPNLELVNNVTDFQSSGYESSTTNTGKLGILQDLLEWNRLDPPDEWEIHRNNLCYNNFTNNRNPFIDFPEWAEFIWGKSVNGSYSSTSTGFAAPSNDKINDFGGGSSTVVSVTGVSVTPDTVSVAKGSTTQLTATISPSNATNQGITWSSDSANATVDSTGVVTGVSAGTATITATTSDGGFTDTCTVSITAPVPTYTVTFDSNGGSSVDSQEVAMGGTISSLPTPTKENYAFGGWYLDDDTFANPFTTSTQVTGNITVHAKWTIQLTDFKLYSGTLTEGDYVVYYNGKALSNTVSSNRLTYEEVTPTNNLISNPSSTTIWHIAPSGNYWTIYNAAVNKYAASNGTKNQAQLLEDGSDDKSLWTVTGSSTYDFSNKYNSANDVNHTLRNNGTYGFACYSTSTGGALSLYKRAESESVSVTGVSLDKTSLTLTVGNSGTLSATITPSDATNKEVTWSSSNPSVATVNNGVVTAVSSGSTTITVTTADGSFEATCSVTVESSLITSISASVSKNYYVGDSIVSSDITVIDNNGNTVTDFSFSNNNYQFTYNDAASGGTLTNKTFANSISASGKTCSLTVQVQRKARDDVGTVYDVLDREFTGVTGTKYSSWSNKAAPNSTAVYAGQSAGSNESIQLRSSNSNSGIITTTSGGRLSKVTVEWNSNTLSGRTLNVYGKNTAYDTPDDLYNESNQGTLLGTIVNGTSTELTVSGSYAFVGIRSADGAMYLTSVTFTYGIYDSATNVANYIMYEDTNGQCNSKFSVAKGYFEGLSKSERATFMSSNDYVISNARTRLNDWASHLGKTITYSDGDYVISSVKNISFNSDGIVLNDSITLVVVLSSVIFITVGGYFLLKKRKVR